MKHEENVDLKRVSRVAKIDAYNKVIQLNKIQEIGIRTWGRIDYLCNILGYRLVKNGIVIGNRFDDDNKKSNREVKKQLKADKANKKMNKKNKKNN